MHDIGDHDAGRTSDEERRQKVSQSQHEGKGCANQKAGKGQRKNDAEKCGARAGSKILRGFDEVSRDVFERRIERKKDKGRICA